MTAPDRAAETPMRDHVAKVLDLMAAGGAIRIMDIPNDASHASYTFSGDVSLAVADFVRNTRAPAEALAVPEVAALEIWKLANTRDPDDPVFLAALRAIGGPRNG